MPRTSARERRLLNVLAILADAELASQVLQVTPIFAFSLEPSRLGTQAGGAGGNGDLVLMKCECS